MNSPMSMTISPTLPPTSEDPEVSRGKPQPGRIPFEWNILHGSETWTDNPIEIAGLSDAPIIEGLLREKEVASVIGAAKTAKTWFSLSLALAVARGEPFLDHDTHERKVLYLDYELKEGTFRKRMSLLSDSRPEGFFYQCFRGAARLPRVDEIAALVERERFGLVVVDSLYRTGWLSEENNNDAVARELSALQDFTRRTSCSLVCVDHTAKGAGAEKSAVDAARGASAKGGFYDALLVLRPTDKGPDPEGTYAILDPVLRDWPRVQDLPLVSFTWTATHATVETAGSVDRNETDANATKILEAVADSDCGISPTALVATTGLGETTVRRVLRDLVGRAKVLEIPDPSHKQRRLYRLPDMADQPRQTAPNPAA